MWECLHCGEEVEEVFDVCWRCQANRDGSPSDLPDPERDEGEEDEITALNENHPAPERDAEDEPEIESFDESPDGRDCLRCHSALRFAGTRELHEGTTFGDPGGIFAKRLTLEVYVCPDCLHVEFFAANARL